MPHALADTAGPLDEAARSLLSPPPAPGPAAVKRSGAATVIYAAAGLFAVVGLMGMATGGQDVEGADPGYSAGYYLGAVAVPVLAALVGLVVQLATKQRRVRTAEAGVTAQRAAWERRHKVWQAAWLCRRCRVGFFPEGAIRPDVPASAAVPVTELPMWVTTTAERVLGAPEPAVAR
ncbi:hypothetical protein J5Y04_35620 [Kitasatospora sp. RG8]|uniref:hypothetical protein n=1 Tax=Kitasatospora sp. RG8 TaxID=2820815 RepID=UPI001ADFE5CE|nr:hypothetical protein [Kitasatospora sp. RG8]MBP0454811.1 hypothetical protein [Kitasatospora sp. RG8]